MVLSTTIEPLSVFVDVKKGQTTWQQMSDYDLMLAPIAKIKDISV
jgi:hypothetical protein